MYGLFFPFIVCFYVCLPSLTHTHLRPPYNGAYARYAMKGGNAFLLNASVHWLLVVLGIEGMSR